MAHITDLDAPTHTSISYAVDRLIGRFGFTEQDRDDLRQELVLDLLERLANYDSRRALPSTFAKECIAHRIYHLVRNRRRKCRDPRRLQGIGVDAGEGEPGDPETESAESLADPSSQRDRYRAELRLDIAGLVAALPQRRREVCVLLADHSPFAISRILGRPKGEVYRDVRAIRAVFAAAGLGECR
jgi:RNA polymerase sigma-70 factor (ECF subfamily)